MSEMSALGVIRSIVPISRFNKGEASRIFDEVASGGTKIVMKNNRPACVLMSPEQYETLMEMVSDCFLLEEAINRMAHYDSNMSLSGKDMMKESGITEADLNDIDVEIEL